MRALSAIGVLFLLAPLVAGQNGNRGPTKQLTGEQAAVAQVPDAKVWRVANQCSVNSIYLFLRLCGKSVTYEAIEERLPPHPTGNSLTELRDCFKALGTNMRILSATPEALQRCPLPAIVHCEEERSTTGHYLIVIGTGPDHVEFIDGTTAIIKSQPLIEFRKNWSGYLLVAEEKPWWHMLFPTAMVLGGVTLGLAVWTHYRQGRTGRAAVSSPSVSPSHT